MSFLKTKKQSKDARKRMEHLMYVAKESPEKVYDLSSCELREVPSSVFAMCKVLQKESLLLHSNLLKNLKMGGGMQDLITLRILDLHGNRISALPKDIGVLKNLQILNVENNALTSLPDAIGDLVNLQTLNTRDNQLNCLPSTIGGAKSLRTLDISGTNKIYYLAKNLCKVRTLEVLNFSHASVMEYPPPHIAEGGLEEIMKFMCKDIGIEYVPPSHNLLPVLGKQTTVVDGPGCSRTEEFENSIMAYEKLKEDKRKQQLELERKLAESQMEEAKLAAKTLGQKANDLKEISKKQEEFDKTISQQQEKQDRERQRMLQMLENAEKNATSLVERLLQMNEKARKQEELREQIELQRLKEEEYFKVTQEDVNNLRKKEMLAAMQSILMENDRFAIRIQEYLAAQEDISHKAQQSILKEDETMSAKILQQQESQKKLVGQIMFEEEMQRQAFLALQFERDAAHRRIQKQILEVESALTELSLVEMKRNNYKIGNEQLESTQALLQSKREELTDLLMVFLKEKTNREEMLKERLVELEEQRESDQIDFWLVQYQRLMDSKPENLITRETQMDVELLKLLSKAGADDHVPSFARNKVCAITDLMELSDNELRSIGVFQVVIRKNILRLIEDERTKSKKLDNNPSPAHPQMDASPAQPQPASDAEDTSLGAENECSVCMERQSNVIFLPCGHVCCCHNCSAKIKKCPMCRVDITQKIQIFRN